MRPSFQDIRDAVGREPNWYDWEGTPRYAPFEPGMLGVYDKMAVLAEIACQSCTAPFLVGGGWTGVDFNLRQANGQVHVYTIDDIIRSFHYGDPPQHGGCSGSTMSCIDVRLVEVWQRPAGLAWERRRDLEQIDITQEWAK